MTDGFFPHVPDYAVPPGETLFEVLEQRGISQAELARRTGRPVKTINEIIKGKAAITPDTAIQLQRVLGIADRFWNNREVQYRAALAREAERQRLSTRASWTSGFPLTEMVKLKLIPKTNDAVETISNLLQFFAVSNIESWEGQWATATPALFRQSTAFAPSTGAVAVWLRWGQVIASHIPCELYDGPRFMNSLQSIRSLTNQPPTVFEPAAKKLCAAAGVALVLTPQLRATHASGATQWLSTDKAIIQLSNRYKTDDHLWFTFFHEAAHIILHGRRDVFVEGLRDGVDRESRELEANAWAADFLIPNEQFARLLQLDFDSPRVLVDFADKLGIAPGIVVGRLQHDGQLPWGTPLNSLKRRFELRFPGEAAETP